MRRVSLLLLLVPLLAAAPASAQQTPTPVPVSDLLQDPTGFSGTITVVGELIGDYGFRSDGSMWTQLNDDSYAAAPVLDGGELTGGNIGVAVRIPQTLAAGLDPPGGYRIRGPVVQVTGTWRYHDPDRLGETYIDVGALAVVEPGRELSESPHPLALGTGVVLIVVALLLRRRKPRRRKAN
jgi:hypothetical protein